MLKLAGFKPVHLLALINHLSARQRRVTMPKLADFKPVHLANTILALKKLNCKVRWLALVLVLQLYPVA